MKKYRILTLMGVMALTAGSMLAQDYDDIYYDASKSKTVEIKTKKSTPAKTVVVYGDVPEKYKVAVQSNYQVERDEDEYNRRGTYDPGYVTNYEIDINGDTIYLDSTYVDDDAFANTRRIERFYNPDIVILSDDDDLVQLYYDESPTINLIVGSDWGYGYGWNYYNWDYYSPFHSYYYPWYTGYYYPWYSYYYRPWYTSWYASWYHPWWHGYYGWDYPWHAWNVHAWDRPGWYRPGWGHSSTTQYVSNPHPGRPGYVRPSTSSISGNRPGLAPNRRGGSSVNNGSGSSRVGNRPLGAGGTITRNRTGNTTTRPSSVTPRTSGNMGSHGSSSGVINRRGGSSSQSYGSRASSTSSYGGNRSSSYGGSRSSSSSGGYRSSGSSSGGYSSGGGGGSHSSGGGGGSHSSGGGGGSHGGSSGGGGHRR